MLLKYLAMEEFYLTFYCELKSNLNQKDIIFEQYNPIEGGSIKQPKSWGIMPVGGLTVDF